MLKNKRKRIVKLLYLIFGVVVGIIICLSVIWWGNYFNSREWHLFGTTKKYISKLFSSTPDSLSARNKIVVVKEFKQIKKINIPDSNANYENYSDEFYYETSDTTKVLTDTNIVVVNNNVSISDDIDYVKKDILLGTKTFILSSSGDDKLLDSLLMVDNNIPKERKFIIEFWKSPINFKGYKKSTNKAIVFGIDNFEKCIVKTINGGLYLIDNDLQYFLENTNSFKKLIITKKTN